MLHRPYRPALDGVRALAVLGVIAYHVSAGKRGGFLGVDVFFVLSGYLITELLLFERAATGTIRLGQFWARRARRLLPAFLVVLLACILVTHASDSVAVWAQRRGDMLSALLYVANWHFIATDQSYFAQFAGVSPLRHVWSLSIEEQFYVAWPLLTGALLVAVRRRPLALVPALIGAAALSAAVMAALYDEANPSRAYYGTDARAHELLLGAALAALVHLRPEVIAAPRARRIARAAGPLVVGIVGLTVLLADDHTRAYYAGGSFLFASAVAGVLWAIEAQPQGLVGALLSAAPLVWIGRISYGLYLWHWPMVVWLPATDRLATLAPRVLQLVEVGATFALAAASFYLLEQPIRRGHVPWLGLSAGRLALVVPLAIAVVGFAAVSATSLQSVSPAARQVTDTSDSECSGPQRHAVGAYGWCSRTNPRTAASAVVATAGDSSSRALDPGMRLVARRRGWRYIQVGQNGCSITRLVLPFSPRPEFVAAAKHCAAAVGGLVSDVRRAARPDVWIVADSVLRRSVMLGDRMLPSGDPRRRAPVRRALRQALAALAGSDAHVVVLGSVPPAQPIECAAKDPRGPGCSDPSHRADWAPVAEVNSDLRAAARALGKQATFVSITNIMCPGAGVCPPLIDGQLARYDGEHFTGSFSRRVVPEIIARAERAGVRFDSHE